MTQQLREECWEAKLANTGRGCFKGEPGLQSSLKQRKGQQLNICPSSQTLFFFGSFIGFLVFWARSCFFIRFLIHTWITAAFKGCPAVTFDLSPSRLVMPATRSLLVLLPSLQLVWRSVTELFIAPLFLSLGKSLSSIHVRTVDAWRGPSSPDADRCQDTSECLSRNVSSGGKLRETEQALPTEDSQWKLF